MIVITDINDERIQLYRSLREQSLSRTVAPSFIAEGEKVAIKALKSRCRIVSVFALEEYYHKHAAILDSANVSADALYSCSRELMTEIIGFSMHQGMLVCVEQPIESRLEELRSPIVALNGLADSENVGVIVRNCVAFGIESIIYDSATASPWLRRAVRVSMGAVFELKVHRCDSLVSTLAKLRDVHRFSIYSAEMHSAAHDIETISFNDKSLIVFGSEGHGISADILQTSDHIIQIPISSSVDSLNVGAASAIVLSHYFSQTTRAIKPN